MTAKEYLQQIKKKNDEINRKIERVEELRSSIASTRSPTLTADRVQTSVAGDKVSETVAKIVDLEAEINADIDSFVDLKEEIWHKVESCCNSKERKIIKLHYFDYISIHLIAVKHMRSDIRWIQRTHKSALNKIQVYLNS